VNLQELLKFVKFVFSIYAAAHADFALPRTRLRFTDRSFTAADQITMNALPLRLRGLVCKDSFRGHLKTHFLNSILNNYCIRR